MSTRRARIKAVTALPPRRKNKDGAASKKPEEEHKEGFESGVKHASGRQSSCDKTSKGEKVSIDSAAQENTKDRFKDRVSPTKRRSSVEKTQGQHQLSVDKTGHAGTKEGFENEPKIPRVRRLSIDKTPKRRLSIDKTPKRRLSINKTPVKRLSVEVIPQDLPLTVEKTVPKITVANENIHQNKAPQTPKTAEMPSSIKPDKAFSWFSNTKILKNLLNSTETSPKNIHPLKSQASRTTVNVTESNVKDSGVIPLESKPSTSKETEGNSSDNEAKKTEAVFFASPRAKATPQRPSPIIRTPIIEVDLIAEKMIAPHKGPNSVSMERNYMEIHAADVCGRPINSEVQVIVEKIINKDEITKLDNALVSKYSVKKIDEYVVKPTETSTVMDGIVPLQPVSKAPKPLDLLKNEIISENAEVLFDPIVPLPSPSKVRPKLRPIPRLGPRRNSIQQGSASESEDENRRLHGRPPTPATPGLLRQRYDSHTSHAIVQRDVARVRNDSVCSTVSHAPSQANAVNSPLREHGKSLKTRREEMAARRNTAMRRRQPEIERDKLTMYDLIFYNPKANPIIPDQDELIAKEANKKDEEDCKGSASQQAGSEAESEAAPAAVPQIKLGPNGEIILDEQSLVVKQSQRRRLEARVVREGAWGGAGSRAYRRAARTADWSDAETVRFYRALAALGTDFTLMQPLFPARSRRDIKLKFKKEERLNLAQVDMALRSGAEWDPTRLEIEFTAERKAAEEEAKKAKELLKREKEDERERGRDMKNLGTRRSKCSKTLGDSALPKRLSQNSTTPCTLDEYVKFQQEKTRKAKQRKPKGRKQGIHLPSSVTLTPIQSQSPPLATLTLLDRQQKRASPEKRASPARNDMAVLTKEVALPVPPNIEKGSLVVLTVNDPTSPSRKMLQTYISQGPGNLAPVSLPANFLNSVVGFMNKSNSPVPTVVGSPSAGKSKTPVLSSRKRTSSYTITQL